MKKIILSSLSILLVCVMLIGALASCAPKSEESTSGTDKVTDVESSGTIESTNNDSGETTTESSSSTETETETETETDEVGPVLEGDNGPLIEHANSLANGVQAYFTDANRTHYSYQNSEMTLTYARANTDKLLVESIKNTKGQSYVEQTMDVFIRMTNGNTFYASDSSEHAEVNIYRFGYYYYQGLFEGQNFIPADFKYDKNEVSIDPKRYTKKESNQVNVVPGDDKGMKVTMTEQIDPHIVYNGFSYKASEYNVLSLTLKSDEISSFQLFTQVNGGTFVADQSTSFAIQKDGEYHTCLILLSTIPGYSGTLNGIRIDPHGSTGNSFSIKEIKLLNANLSEVPQYVSISRQFHVYTDKMHQLIQFATLQDTENVAAVGTVTKIDAATVDQLLVKDKNGEHTSLDKVDWDSVQCVGFDIKNAGIFGYIMPVDEVAGSIMVTLVDGNYVIEQTRVPDDNTLIASEKNTRNANDFYIGNRIYTDENHDFEEFLYENWCEQEPLIAKNIKVSALNSDQGSFAGYDAKRGVYVLKYAYAEHSFFESYYKANRNFKINFSVSAGEVARDIYIMTYTSGSTLECAALLGEDLLHLPVPIEVIKNFSEASGDRNLYNLDDPTFSEAIFPLTLEAGEIYEYNILNLYQNWGNYPLKQISSIPFFSPYYHLSTGTTETNCITPWFETRPATKVSLSTLPDFRGWSSSFWATQPQHTSSGTHHWLAYTDADGQYSAVECIKNTITSYGPTYAEVIMDHISDDGKIAVSYTHMEMPQVDENRTYYTMEYKVLEDVTIKDFKNNFQFYSVTDNNGTGLYREIGYLDENNEYAHADANFEDSNPRYYKLGDKCPYFSYYNMGGKYDAETNPNGYRDMYSNVAFLVYNYEFNVSTFTETPSFIIIEQDHWVTLSLDLDEVTLKAGDTITINAIALPWGSEELDGTYDKTKDQSARNVREDTLLNPLTVKSDTDEIIESPYLPKVKSKDGKTAEFTLSGGENNVSVRIYGFDKLTAPKVQELVDGKWVDYDLSSANHPDEYGYYHYYDGYGVQYDGDGTYSYSFVTTMYDGAPRTFRISADEDFAGWPAEVPPQGNPDHLDVYVDPEEMLDAGEKPAADFFSSVTLSTDKSYVTFEANPQGKYPEGYISAYKYNKTDKVASGKYFVIKYRVPKENPEKLGVFQIYLSTVADGPSASGKDLFNINPVQDGEWHVIVVDVESLKLDSFVSEEDTYYVRFIRFDMFNKKHIAGVKVDVAYLGMAEDLMDICKLNEEEFKTISFLSGGKTQDLNTATGEVAKDIIIDPSATVTLSTLPFGSALDSTNNIPTNGVTIGSAIGGPKTLTGITVDKNLKINLKGWCVVDGGVQKFVWSADGGKTWQDCSGNETLASANDRIMSSAKSHAGKAFSDYSKSADFETTKSKLKTQFQGVGLTIDLSAYANSKVNVLFAAVPASEPDKLILVYRFKDVQCTFEEEKNEIIDPEANVTISTLPFGAALDWVNGAKTLKATGSQQNPPLILSGLTANAALSLIIEGRCLVDGGIEKYVWSADGGKTWNDCDGLKNATTTSDKFLNATISYSGEFSDPEGAKQKAQFMQGSGGLTIDLKAYKDQIVDVIFAAVPVKEPDNLVIVFYFKGVSCKSASKLDESSVMAESFLPYSSNLDSVNTINHNAASSSNEMGTTVSQEFVLDANGKLKIGGWNVVEGGVAKYVWTPDNGKTWYDCGGSPVDAGADVIGAASARVVGITNSAETRKNGSFQGGKIFINLSEYADSDDIPDIWLCAVPKNNTNSVCLLYKFTNIVKSAE